MRSNLTFCILTLISSLTMGQSIGLKIEKEFSNTKTINNSLGFGIFISFDDFSEKFVVITYGDLIKKNWEYNAPSLETIMTTHSRGIIGVTGLFVNQLSNNINFRVGPDLNHNWIGATKGGKVANWINTYNANFIGLGLTTNFNFHKVFKLPFNFDIFVTPNYLLNIKDYGDYSWTSNFDKNLIIINVQIGISFILADK